MKTKIFLLALALIPSTSFADLCKTTIPINTKTYATEIGTRKVTFLAVDFKNKNCHVINESGLAQRHAPYSTFKIPNTLIALETGAVKSIDERIEWDQVKYPARDFWPKTWKQSHSLETAFKHSAVWYYRELATRINTDDYKTWLARFRYGNQTFTPGSNEFWLNGELTISPKEQVEFISCLMKSRCGVSAKTFSAFEAAALQHSSKGASLYAKTGSGSVDPKNNDGAFEGWYVGYIKDKSDEPVTGFAIFVEAESFSSLKDFRQAFSVQLLEDLGFWNP